MPHQCVHCGKIYEVASKEIIEGCSCGSHFFFFIKQEQFDALKDKKISVELKDADKRKVEKEVREIVGAEEEEIPVILDLESVRVIAPGKFELDVVNLFNKKRPLIYKLEEGKYIIDLASTMKAGTAELEKRMKRVK
jgi:predicted  nucleic acid-binding Zn-ribbon protein